MFVAQTSSFVEPDNPPLSRPLVHITILLNPAPFAKTFRYLRYRDNAHLPNIDKVLVEAEFLRPSGTLFSTHVSYSHMSQFTVQDLHELTVWHGSVAD